MDPMVVVAAGLVLATLVFVLPRLCEQYGEAYEDEQAFFRHLRPRMWVLINDGTDTGDPSESDPNRPPGRCPVCGADNDPGYTYCHDCHHRLPDASE